MEGADPSGLNLDPSLLQTTIGSLLQSPAAAQMFLNTLNASSQAQSLGQTQNGHTPSKLGNANYGQYGDNQDPTMALFSPLPSSLVNNTNDLVGAYQKAAGVGGDVDKLQESIDSLVRSMGLDLPQHNGSAPNMPASNLNADSTLPSEGTFDDTELDDLLDQLAQSSGPNAASEQVDA